MYYYEGICGMNNFSKLKFGFGLTQHNSGIHTHIQYIRTHFLGGKNEGQVSQPAQHFFFIFFSKLQ